MKYFINVTTLEELKKQYRRLAMIHHPDCGGSTEAMQEVNDEHDRLFEILKKQHNERAAADTTGKTRATTETPEEFRRIVEALIKLDGIVAELCGCWIWCSGETKKHKEALKYLGFRWSNSKKMWYWHHEEAGRRWRKGNCTMDTIRTKYGSQVFKGNAENASANLASVV